MVSVYHELLKNQSLKANSGALFLYPLYIVHLHNALFFCPSLPSSASLSVCHALTFERFVFANWLIGADGEPGVIVCFMKQCLFVYY